MNETEKQFHDGALKMGYKVLRNGFTDFVLVNPYNPTELIFVEVKGKSKAFTDAQRRMLDSLRNAGNKVIVSHNGVLTDVPELRAPDSYLSDIKSSPNVRTSRVYKCECCGTDSLPFETWTRGGHTIGWKFRCTNKHEFLMFGENIDEALTRSECIKRDRDTIKRIGESIDRNKKLTEENTKLVEGLKTQISHLRKQLEVLTKIEDMDVVTPSVHHDSKDSLDIVRSGSLLTINANLNETNPPVSDSGKSSIVFTTHGWVFKEGLSIQLNIIKSKRPPPTTYRATNPAIVAT